MSLYEVLKCPHSNESIIDKETHLESASGVFMYPKIQGIPWLLRHPIPHLMEWQNKLINVSHYHSEQKFIADSELRKVELLKSTKERLKILSQAHDKNSEFFKNLAIQLNPSAALKENEKEKAFYEKQPRQQTVGAYFKTVFRDWNWGSYELEAQMRHILPHLENAKRILFLGAGACGLPARLHNIIKPELSVAMDINPALFLIGHDVLNGKSVELFEIPTVSQSLAQTATLQTLKLHEPLQKGFYQVFADGQEPPVLDESFDAIVTLWFIDIVPMDFRDLARFLHFPLKKHGVWINLGQLGFERNQLSSKYSADEVTETLEGTGYKILQKGMHDLPYLQSPSDTVRRMDSIFFFAARREGHAKRPPQFHYLPEWLINWSTPIPREQAMGNLLFKSQVYAQLLSLVDGQRSLSEVVQEFGKISKMPDDAARHSVYQFFLNLYENKIFRDF